MKTFNFFFFINLCLLPIFSFAQENISEKILLFPEFKQGIITFNNGNKIYSQLNYNTYKEEMIYIDKQNDTLVIANPSHIAEIKIEDHLFENYKNDIFFEKTNTPFSDLYIRWKTKSHSKGKKMPYGGQTNSTSNDTRSLFLHPDNQTYKLQTNEDLIIEENYTFYIKEGNDFKKLDSSKSLSKAFNTDESMIKDYIKSQKLNIKKSGDMRKTIEYLMNTK